PQKLSDAILAPRERSYSRARVLDVLRRVERGQLRLLLRSVFERRNVERPDVALSALAFALLVEAALRFVAEQAALDHSPDEIWQAVRLALLVLRHGLVNVLRDVRENVEADDVERSEGRRLRSAKRRPRHPVNLFDGVAVLLQHPKRHHRAVSADAVGYEVRSVFRHHDALAEPLV